MFWKIVGIIFIVIVVIVILAIKFLNDFPPDSDGDI